MNISDLLLLFFYFLKVLSVLYTFTFGIFFIVIIKMLSNQNNLIHVFPETPQHKKKAGVENRTNLRYLEQNHLYNANNPYLISPTSTNSQLILPNQLPKKNDSYSEKSSTKSLKNACMHQLKVLKKPILKYSKVSKINSQEKSGLLNQSHQKRLLQRIANLQQQNRDLRAQNIKLKRTNEVILKQKRQQVNTLNVRMQQLENIILELQNQMMKSSQYDEDR